MDCNVLHTYEALLIMITLPVQRLVAVLFHIKDMPISSTQETLKNTEWMEGWMDSSNHTLFSGNSVPGRHNVLDTILCFIFIAEMGHNVHFTAE